MKNIPVLVCFLALFSLALFAQTGERPRMVHTTEKSAIHIPPQEAPTALKVIFSNLGTSKTDLYNDAFGSVISVNESLAVPFTPKSDSHISQVQVAAQYQDGANEVHVSIYEGSGDIPETLLAGPVKVKNLPDFGTCCTLAAANFSPLAVSAGTKYWVVLGTPLTGTGSDFEGVWVEAVKPLVPIAINELGHWVQLNADSVGATEVLGTIP